MSFPKYKNVDPHEYLQHHCRRKTTVEGRKHSHTHTQTHTHIYTHTHTMLYSQKSGFNKKIAYSPSQSRRINRKRQIVWFNPPYSVNVKTSASKRFLTLVHKQLPRNHEYHKLFNRGNIKLSESVSPI